VDLNPQLYAALKRKFNGNVRIVNEGIKNVWRTVFKGDKKERELISRGQNFATDCPFCNDTRQRLYISYEWGVDDPITGRPDLRLANCFNEQCLSYNPHYREVLFFEILYGKPINRTAIRPGRIREPGTYTPPGVTVPINELATDHIAYQYLANRGFNLTILSKVYKISWCQSSDNKMVANRIIIPIISEDKEIGWLGRLAHDSALASSSGRKIPKYYNMPNLRSERLLYNFDLAKQFKTLIIVEGAFDSIVVGAPSVGVFGKTVSNYNLDRLMSHVTKNDVLVVIAFDPDKPANDRQSKHHIEVASNKFKHFHQKVMSLYLPTGTDPASLGRSQFKQLLYEAANMQNFKLDFTRIVH
jgi:hypothetical protein